MTEEQTPLKQLLYKRPFWVNALAIGLLAAILYTVWRARDDILEFVTRKEFLILLGIIVVGLVIYQSLKRKRERGNDALELIEKGRQYIHEHMGLFMVPPKNQFARCTDIPNGSLLYYSTRGIELRYDSFLDRFTGISHITPRRHEERCKDESMDENLKKITSEIALRNKIAERELQ